MSETRLQDILKDPRYQKLAAERRRLQGILSVLILAIYYGFILVIAFAPKSLGTKVADGATMSVGFPIGVGVILSAIILTGIYVWVANTKFDGAMRELLGGRK